MLAERGDSRALRSLFGAKARPAVAGGSRDERLLRAAQQGDRATLRGLLKESRAVPLELAARLLELAVAAQDAAMLALLLGHGLDGAVSDGLLIAAIDASCDPCVDALLQAGAAPDAVARDGRPALLVAARDGRSGSMAALLTAGAPVDVMDPAGRTALWWATRNGHSEVAVALLAAGATTAPDRDGVAPLHLAAQNDDGVLLRQLLPLVPVDLASNAGSSALQLAAHAGALTAARLLLGAGAEVDRRDPAGDTALMVAARAGQLDMADMLLRAGASLTQRNERFENARDLMADRPEPGWQVLLTRTDGGLGNLLGWIGGDQSR